MRARTRSAYSERQVRRRLPTNDRSEQTAEAVELVVKLRNHDRVRARFGRHEQDVARRVGRLPTRQHLHSIACCSWCWSRGAATRQQRELRFSVQRLRDLDVSLMAR